jgi:type VI secretion system ImpM family protein
VDFVNLWDSWLQNCFSESRNKLGNLWQEAYENAPIWRFCFGAKICGPDPMIGVMMPSQDRVARCFPLTLFVRLKNATTASALEIEPFMTELEDTVLNTLSEGQGRKELDLSLEKLSIPDFPMGSTQNESHWLSTFYAGQARIDRRNFLGLPKPVNYLDLLDPNRGAAYV